MAESARPSKMRPCSSSSRPERLRRSFRIRRLVVAVLILFPAGAARAQSAWRSRAAATFDARGEIGTGDVAGISLGALGAGVEWRLVPTLRLRTIALVLGGTGSTDTGRSAGGGAGGELAARLV